MGQSQSNNVIVEAPNSGEQQDQRGPVQNPDLDRMDHHPQTHLGIVNPRKFYSRFKRSKLFTIFFYTDKGYMNSDIGSDDIDNMVNLFTLVNTLILTIPFGLMGTLQSGAWDAYEQQVFNCTDPMYQKNPDAMYFQSRSDARGKWTNFDLSINSQYSLTATAIVYSVFVPLTCMILAVLYYIIRPASPKEESGKIVYYIVQQGNFSRYSEGDVIPNSTDYLTDIEATFAKQEKRAKEDEISEFRLWWFRGRFLVLLMMIGMIGSVVAMIYLCNSYFIVFMSSSDLFCTWVLWRSRTVTIGWATLLGVVSVSLILFI
jgi:hypothetical protein